MTDAERFDVVLEELRVLLLRLGDLADHVVLVGGQVIAVEARAAGEDGRVQVETGTGLRVDRGFTMEPDLLFDFPSVERHGDELTMALAERGFRRVRAFRWRKDVGGAAVEIDLFAPFDADENSFPAQMTRLPGSDAALARPARVRLDVRGKPLEIKVPDPAGFLVTKLIAKTELRPDETKDSLDVFVYVQRHGIERVAMALRTARERDWVLARLSSLFGTPSSDGVRDVLAASGLADAQEGELLARAVTELFAELVERVR